MDNKLKGNAYAVGRMIAILEHYAGSKFGPNTLPTLFSHPTHGYRVWARYVDKTDPYYQELVDIDIPVTTPNKVVEGQMWIGYYHQKARYTNKGESEYERKKS